jgi:opacity protein-like surface antigen
MNRKVARKTTGMLVASAAVAACSAVQAADPIPDSFTLGGVTLYATIDVGYAYQSQGVPLSGKYLGGLEYQAFTTTRSR